MTVRLSMMILVALTTGCPGTGETPLKVMSFNLRHGLANDGANAWPHRRDILVDAIRQYDPDILGTQECREFQAEYIAEKLPEYRWIGIGRDKDGHGETTAVFFKKKDFIPVESGHFWLSETPEVPGSMSWDTDLTRMVTWVRFHHPPSGKFFHVFNTHFDHRGEIAREKSAELLIQRVAALPGDYPVIATGDFNAVGGSSRPWEILTGGGLHDAWRSAERRDGPETTISRFKAPEPNDTTRIDWILYRGPLDARRAETITFNQDGRYPSDHYPVIVEFTLHP